MIIAIDTREQRPFTFEDIDPQPVTEVKTLQTGDYSIVGYESEIVVERKSCTDLFGSVGKGRNRFHDEFLRMVPFRYAAVVCEADWLGIMRSPPQRSKLPPKVVLATMIAWQQRYGVHFWACPTREFAEKTTYRILERFYKDYQEGYHL